MWERIKHVSAKTWAAVAVAVAAVVAFIVKLVWDRQDTTTADAVTEAEDKKVAEEFHDAQEATRVVAEAEAHEEEVQSKVEVAVSTGPANSPEQIDAITDELAEMSRRRHDEALARARK